MEGNDRYEGFTIDLIDKLSEILGFNYEFEVENNYGKLRDDGTWEGMAGALIDEVRIVVITVFHFIHYLLNALYSYTLGHYKNIFPTNVN